MDRCREKKESIIKKAKLISDPVDAEEHNMLGYTFISVELHILTYMIITEHQCLIFWGPKLQSTINCQTIITTISTCNLYKKNVFIRLVQRILLLPVQLVLKKTRFGYSYLTVHEYLLWFAANHHLEAAGGSFSSRRFLVITHLHSETILINLSQHSVIGWFTLDTYIHISLFTHWDFPKVPESFHHIMI